MRKHKLRFETKLTLLYLSTSIPLLVTVIYLQLKIEMSVWLVLITAYFGILSVAFIQHAIHKKLTHEFRSLNNLLESISHGDFSIRARSDYENGELGYLFSQINGLAQELGQHKIENVERQLLLDTVIEHMDVAIVAINNFGEVRFLNKASKNLLKHDSLDERTTFSEQLSFAKHFTSGQSEVIQLSLGDQHGKFNIHVEEFREAAKQHKLLFITDVRKLLRNEERQAWQRLVRVISHEINNSLSPIISINHTLQKLISKQEQLDFDTKSLHEGLEIIGERADNLRKFIGRYKHFAQVPKPNKTNVSISSLIKKMVLLFDNDNIKILSQDDVDCFIDHIQIEQVLINLIKNAFESMQATDIDRVVTIQWEANKTTLTLYIRDQGSGISNPENLFTPFYTTKKEGSGTGLILCRTIVEAHNGQLSLKNNHNGVGSCATIQLPLYHGPSKDLNI